MFWALRCEENCVFDWLTDLLSLSLIDCQLGGGPVLSCSREADREEIWRYSECLQSDLTDTIMSRLLSPTLLSLSVIFFPLSLTNPACDEEGLLCDSLPSDCPLNSPSPLEQPKIIPGKIRLGSKNLIVWRNSPGPGWYDYRKDSTHGFILR